MGYEEGVTKFIMPRDMSFKNKDKVVIYEAKKGDTLTYKGWSGYKGSVYYSFEELEGEYPGFLFTEGYSDFQNPKIAWEESYGELIEEYLDRISNIYGLGDPALSKIEEMVYTRLREGKYLQTIKEDLTELLDTTALEK